MNVDQAQSAVTLSAFVVASIYAYRRLTAGSTVPPPAPSSHFVVGFGFTYIVLSLLAQAAPALGGMGAILVATGDLLANGKALTGALQTSLKTTKTATRG